MKGKPQATQETREVMNTLTTSFVKRLRDRDDAAWFELWEVFGPVLRVQLSKWGRGRIGGETVRDLTQETLAALSDSIDRYDPTRGARFSTWLLSIAKHALGDEIDRRMALKRGAGRKAIAFDERYMAKASGIDADRVYEQNVFRANRSPNNWGAVSRRSAGIFSACETCFADGWPRRSRPTVSPRRSSERCSKPASAMTT